MTPPRAEGPASGSSLAGAERDTLLGVPAVVGSERDIRVALHAPDGKRSAYLSGPQAEVVGRVSGAQVWVSGRRQADGTLFVDRFAVRSVDGAQAHDGTLVAQGDQLVLVTADAAHHTLVRPPAGLRGHVGARVWVSGPLDREPLAFGIIQDKR